MNSDWNAEAIATSLIETPRPIREPRRRRVAYNGRTPSFAVLDPAKQPPDHRRLFLPQIEVQARLSQALDEWKHTGLLLGLVVMPTGAGKTYTLVNWLVSKVINTGDRVVWIAPNDLLVEQAARTFYQAAGLAKESSAGCDTDRQWTSLHSG